MKKPGSDLIKNADRYVETHIGEFHLKRLQSLEKLKLSSILKRKNPYLFRAKNILFAQEFVKAILDAHLSSQEETIFGDFLEGLAVHICQMAYGGRKSTTEGIDLELDKDKIRYVIAIKSGPNWGNSQQISRMRDNFKRAVKVTIRLIPEEISGQLTGATAGMTNLKKAITKNCAGRDFGNLSPEIRSFTSNWLSRWDMKQSSGMRYSRNLTQK